MISPHAETAADDFADQSCFHGLPSSPVYRESASRCRCRPRPAPFESGGRPLCRRFGCQGAFFSISSSRVMPVRPSVQSRKRSPGCNCRRQQIGVLSPSVPSARGDDVAPGVRSGLLRGQNARSNQLADEGMILRELLHAPAPQAIDVAVADMRDIDVAAPRHSIESVVPMPAHSAFPCARW